MLSCASGSSFKSQAAFGAQSIALAGEQVIQSVVSPCAQCAAVCRVLLHWFRIWTVRIFSCVSFHPPLSFLQTLEGHTNNVSAVAFHPELPVILTGSEDGTIKIWHGTTYRLEISLSYGMERVWAIGVTRGTNAVAAGYDEGVVLMRMGNEEPVASMDSTGRIILSLIHI